MEQLPSVHYSFICQLHSFVCSEQIYGMYYNISKCKNFDETIISTWELVFWPFREKKCTQNLYEMHLLEQHKQNKENERVEINKYEKMQFQIELQSKLFSYLLT